MPGNISKLTVAVMVDGTYKMENGKPVYAPRSPEEVKSLKQLVENAVGYNEARGDQITVVSIPFVTDIGGADMVRAENRYLQFFKTWQRTIFNVALAALVFLFIIRPFMNKFRQVSEGMLKLPAPEGGSEGESSALLIDKPSEQISMRKKSAALVQYDPDRATEIIREWLQDKV